MTTEDLCKFEAAINKLRRDMLCEFDSVPGVAGPFATLALDALSTAEQNLKLARLFLHQQAAKTPGSLGRTATFEVLSAQAAAKRAGTPHEEIVRFDNRTRSRPWCNSCYAFVDHGEPNREFHPEFYFKQEGE